MATIAEPLELASLQETLRKAEAHLETLLATAPPSLPRGQVSNLSKEEIKARKAQHRFIRLANDDVKKAKLEIRRYHQRVWKKKQRSMVTPPAASNPSVGTPSRPPRPSSGEMTSPNPFGRPSSSVMGTPSRPPRPSSGEMMGTPSSLTPFGRAPRPIAMTPEDRRNLANAMMQTLNSELKENRLASDQFYAENRAVSSATQERILQDSSATQERILRDSSDTKEKNRIARDEVLDRNLVARCKTQNELKGIYGMPTASDQEIQAQVQIERRIREGTVAALPSTSSQECYFSIGSADCDGSSVSITTDTCGFLAGNQISDGQRSFERRRSLAKSSAKTPATSMVGASRQSRSNKLNGRRGMGSVSAASKPEEIPLSYLLAPKFKVGDKVWHSKRELHGKIVRVVRSYINGTEVLDYQMEVDPSYNRPDPILDCSWEYLKPYVV